MHTIVHAEGAADEDPPCRIHGDRGDLTVRARANGEGVVESTGARDARQSIDRISRVVGEGAPDDLPAVRLSGHGEDAVIGTCADVERGIHRP